MNKPTKHSAHAGTKQTSGRTVPVQNAVFGEGIQAPPCLLRTVVSVSAKQKKGTTNTTRNNPSGNSNQIRRNVNPATDGAHGRKMSIGSIDKKTTQRRQSMTKDQGDPRDKIGLFGKHAQNSNISGPKEIPEEENHVENDEETFEKEMGARFTSGKNSQSFGAGTEASNSGFAAPRVFVRNNKYQTSSHQGSSVPNSIHVPSAGDHHGNLADDVDNVLTDQKMSTNGRSLDKKEIKNDDFDFPANFRADGRISGTKASRQPEAVFSFTDDSQDVSNDTENSMEQTRNSDLSRVHIFTSSASIVELTVDVVVSSDDSVLHGGGMIAKAISKNGGKALEVCKECIRQICSCIRPWTVQPTPATGELKCKHVYHAVVPRFSPQSQIQWMEGFRALIFEILHRSECMGFESLALPLLGTGNNGAPTEFGIDLLSEEINNYAGKKTEGTLKSIILVHPDKNVQQYLMKRVRSLKNVSSKNIFNAKEKTETVLSYSDFFLKVEGTQTDNCPICMEEVESKEMKRLAKCNHIFCEKCIGECFKRAPVCPVCNMVYGPMTGSQPKGLMVEIFNREQRLPGYDNCGTIQIMYSFPDGRQSDEHPHPGCMYKGTRRMAFLPDNSEGQKVHRLLRRAFEQRLVFTIGSSRTTGKDDVVTWNDIHHKTKIDGGPEKFGYPDPSYLSRVTEELAAKGITEG